MKQGQLEPLFAEAFAMREKIIGMQADRAEDKVSLATAAAASVPPQAAAPPTAPNDDDECAAEAPPLSSRAPRDDANEKLVIST